MYDRVRRVYGVFDFKLNFGTVVPPSPLSLPSPASPLVCLVPIGP